MAHARTLRVVRTPTVQGDGLWAKHHRYLALNMHRITGGNHMAALEPLRTIILKAPQILLRAGKISPADAGHATTATLVQKYRENYLGRYFGKSGIKLREIQILGEGFQ
jgi:hypothetical protein